MLLIVALLAGAPAAAAFPAASAHAQEDADAGKVRVRTRVVRPPEGSMRRGNLPVPSWLVYALGGLIVVGAGGVLAWRVARKKRS